MILAPWAMPLGLVYREWLLRLARQEADAGCPRLLAMKSEHALYFADLTETCGAECRYNLMCARIKWLCTGNYGYPPVPVTEQEAAAGARWQPPEPYRVALIRTPEVVRAMDREKQEQGGGYKINKPLLKRTINRAMRERFGKSSGGSYYETQLGDLTVTTTLDFGVRYDQFGYLQGIRTAAFKTILRHGGVLTLLGEPQTRWGRLTNEDIPATAELLVGLCAEFVDAVPEMWERSGLAGKPLPDERKWK